MTLPAVRFVQQPSAWPEAPTEFSVSSLLGIERCPRSWALRRGDYLDVWERSGYPPITSSAALSGSVVHLALERIVESLVREGCKTVRDGCAIGVLRSLGGHRQNLIEAIERVLSRWDGNPRVEPRLSDFRADLFDSLPDLRLRVQQLLSRIRLGEAPPRGGHTRTRERFPLTSGSYSEVRMRASDLGWTGVADLITLEDEGVEIRDFKTGSVADSHAFQLQCYALIWSHDSVSNPDGKPPTSLVISYPHGDVRIDPLAGSQLDAFERELVERTKTARDALIEYSPEAMPSKDNCSHCSVRHLCDDFWSPANLNLLRNESAAPRWFEDIQLRLTRELSATMWVATVVRSPNLAAEETVLLKLGATDMGLARKSREVRLLGAQVIQSHDDSQSGIDILIKATRHTEVFGLPPN